MKIMHIAEPFASGVLRFLIDITKRQIEEYEIYILYGVRPLTPENVEQLFDKRIHLIKIESFKGAMGTVLNPKAYIDVYKYYKQIKPDIIHLHSSASGFVGRWILPCSKIPSFYTPHGYSFLMKDCSIIKRLLFWSIEYISAKRPAITIACSKGEYNEAIKLSKNSTYVNNGINIKELEPYLQNKTNFNTPIKVCTSGRILYQKNPSLFNEIATLLPNIEFIWIGDGDLKTELTAPNIRITGWMEREKVLEIIKNSDFFILTSLWEGLPIALLEAMYLRKICLVTDVIGNRDVIVSKQNGMICHNAKEFADTITNIIENRLDGRLMAENASTDVKENYNEEIMVQNYDIIYKKNATKIIF